MLEFGGLWKYPNNVACSKRPENNYVVLSNTVDWCMASRLYGAPKWQQFFFVHGISHVTTN